MGRFRTRSITIWGAITIITTGDGDNNQVITTITPTTVADGATAGTNPRTPRTPITTPAAGANRHQQTTTAGATPTKAPDWDTDTTNLEITTTTDGDQ